MTSAWATEPMDRILLAVLLLLGCGGAPDAPPASAPTTAPAAAAPAFVPDPLLTEPRFRTMILWPEYQGEEVAGGHFETAVVYLDEKAREKHRVMVRDGRLLDIAGKPFNPGPRPEKWSGDKGLAIYVMDAAGNVYATLEHERGRFHHSSFLAGGPVGMAGDIRVFDGWIVEVSNQSGHYRPPPAAMKQITERLKEMGVDMSKVKVEVLGADLPLGARSGTWRCSRSVSR